LPAVLATTTVAVAVATVARPQMPRAADTAIARLGGLPCPGRLYGIRYVADQRERRWPIARLEARFFRLLT
jgi:hypothetical protein